MPGNASRVDGANRIAVAREHSTASKPTTLSSGAALEEQRALISRRGSSTGADCPGGDGMLWKCDGSSNGKKLTKHGKECKVECLAKGQKPQKKKVECDDGTYKP